MNWPCRRRRAGRTRGIANLARPAHHRYEAEAAGRVFLHLAFDRLFYVMPRESEGGFDPRFEIRGYGPWLMSENRSGIIRTWTKNGDYHVKGRLFIDKIEQPIVLDYASRLAMFKAGQIWAGVVSWTMPLDTKRAIPDLLMRQADSYATAPSSLAFGYDNDSPWRDERLRQAASFLIDRETVVDLKTDRGRLEAGGAYRSTCAITARSAPAGRACGSTR